VRTPTFLLAFCGFQLTASPAAPGQVVQVHQDFSRDPGWDHHRNRTVGTEMPAVISVPY
jgi:hypothetical protein